MAIVLREWEYAAKLLPDGRRVSVFPLIYGARLGVSAPFNTTDFLDVW